jgi:hypothetical protein
MKSNTYNSIFIKTLFYVSDYKKYALLCNVKIGENVSWIFRNKVN